MIDILITLFAWLAVLGGVGLVLCMAVLVYFTVWPPEAVR